MNPKPAPLRKRSHRLVRQLHLWIGAWGALAAVADGFSGLVMNHRFGAAAWPQGDSEELGRQELVVPAPARETQLARTHPISRTAATRRIRVLVTFFIESSCERRIEAVANDAGATATGHILTCGTAILNLPVGLASTVFRWPGDSDAMRFDRNPLRKTHTSRF